MSLWEPILEPIESKNGQQQLWDVNIDVKLEMLKLDTMSKMCRIATSSKCYIPNSILLCVYVIFTKYFQVMKTPVNQLKLNGAKATDPQICLDISATSPLQITLTRASLELIKSLADVSNFPLQSHYF